MTNLTLEWITGFIEGEGSFHLRIAGNQHKRYPHFNISNTDKKVLEEIRDYFGFGYVQPVACKKANRKASWQYVVSKRIELLKLADAVSPKLRSETKKEQFKIWMDGFKVYKKSTG